MFVWQLQGNRTTPLVPEFAAYFNTTNDVQFNPFTIGIDTLVLFSNLVNIMFYPFMGYLTDKYGILVMIFGSWSVAVGTLWWYLSFTNYNSVLASRVLTSLGGVSVASSLLRISGQWFPGHQRAIAVALATVSSLLGTGSSLIIASLFNTEVSLINTDLLSCKESFSDLNNETIEDGIECTNEALDDFCCSAPTDIER